MSQYSSMFDIGTNAKNLFKCRDNKHIIQLKMLNQLHDAIYYIITRYNVSQYLDTQKY
jgi:hypothetical protein